jgi:hypothetical protein
MKSFTSAMKILVVFLILASVAYFCVAYYSWVFSKRVKGEIVGVERVTESTAILSSRVTEAQMHLYSILIRGSDGQLYTTSSEDSRWQVAKVGFCVEALLYRYPPWNVERANAFFNAQIIQLSDCPGHEGKNPEAGAPAAPHMGPTTEPAIPPATGGNNPAH